MFRPTSHLARKIPNCTVQAVRGKIIYPAATVDKVQRMKQWNRDNRELFGPLLETRKQKNKKNNPDKNSTPPNISASDLELVGSFLKSQNAVASVESQKEDRNMWSKAKSGLKLTNVSGFKTLCSRNAAHNPSTVDTGFATEDKILQIKQYKNDYSQEYPSVTLILNKTMTEESRTALEKWKQERIAEMGLDEFNKFYEAQMAVGTKFHNTLKRYFTEPQHKLAIEKDIEGVWNSVGELLKNVSSPKAIESNVVHPVLKYRGIIDAIADYEDKPTLIEWKKSDKPRKAISLTYDNPVQLAAYFGAVSNDLNYKHLNVRDSLLVIAYTDGSKADVYHLSVDKLREHWAHWLSRLENYAKKHGSDSEKILKGGKRLFEEDIGNLQ